MYRPTGVAWTLADLRDLFAQHFGDKLSPDQLEQLARDCAAAHADRSRLASGVRDSAVPCEA
jgi:hypothetical protein